jgi:FKBP-type peptidyl-prolyl cis-trans isomerase 2
MKKAREGDQVKLKCTGRVRKQEFYTTADDELLEFKIGDRQVVPGLEKAVIGMQVGQQKSVTITPEEGYGQWREDLVEKANKGQFPDHISLEVGKKLQIKFEDGNAQEMKITAIDGSVVTLDANHPLAGYNLHFDIEVVAIG